MTGRLTILKPEDIGVMNVEGLNALQRQRIVEYVGTMTVPWKPCNPWPETLSDTTRHSKTLHDDKNSFQLLSRFQSDKKRGT